MAAPDALKPRAVGADGTGRGVQCVHYGVRRSRRFGGGGRKRHATQPGRIVDLDRRDAFGHGPGGQFGDVRKLVMVDW